MNQLSFFERRDEPLSRVVWHLAVDGASRNNPGPAGAGLVITKDKKPFLQKGFYLGVKTNNQAEYTALLLGFFFLEPIFDIMDELHIVSDSQLLVRQLNGTYKVREPKIVPLYLCARSFLQKKNYILEHVMREHNARADKMANDGINKKIELPADFVHFCARYQ